MPCGLLSFGGMGHVSLMLYMNIFTSACRKNNTSPRTSGCLAGCVTCASKEGPASHTDTPAGLSSGTLFLAVAASVVAVYCGVGMGMNKFKYRRDGLDVIPNRLIWLNLARLVANGCCYFRHRVASEPSAYAPCRSPYPCPLPRTTPCYTCKHSFPPLPVVF